MRTRGSSLLFSSGLLAAVIGCGEEAPVRTNPDLGVAPSPLEAYCSADVQGVGPVDVETDYLAHVVACENGGASFEALRAQAIAARSFLYYKLETAGSVGDGTGDQVYTCNNAPDSQHHDAVASTSGLVLTYSGVVVCSFYVAGALQQGASCMGGTDDPTGTEKWVTYNDGLEGDAIHQTELGFVDPQNYRNRGCKSQNGAHCLSDAGWIAEDIVRFYYGEDIGLEVAEGPCVTPPITTSASTGAGGSGGSVLQASSSEPDDSGCAVIAGGRDRDPVPLYLAALAALASGARARRKVAGGRSDA